MLAVAAGEYTKGVARSHSITPWHSVSSQPDHVQLQEHTIAIRQEVENRRLLGELAPTQESHFSPAMKGSGHAVRVYPEPIFDVFVSFSVATTRFFFLTK